MENKTHQQLSPYVRFATSNQIVYGPIHIDRVIFDYELLLIEEGAVTVIIEGETYNAAAGDLFLIKPGVAHTITLEKGGRFLQPHIHFDLLENEQSKTTPINFKPLQGLSSSEKGLFRDTSLFAGIQSLPYYMRPVDLSRLKHLIYEIAYAFESRQPFSNLEMKGLMIQLLSYLQRAKHYQTHDIQDTDMQLAARIKQYLDDHSESPLSLDMLQNHFLISRFLIIDIFKKAYRMTPIHYHNMVRIEKAKELLIYTTMTITEISEHLGYINIHSFSRAFKRESGMTPSSLPRPSRHSS